MSPRAELETVAPKDRAQWRVWLEEHHAGSPGVWLTVRKKGSDLPGVGYEEAVEEALCFGRIDSTVNRLDDHRFKQLMTPRKPASTWSKSNKARVARLAADGLMTPAGLAVIEAAKADGSWTILDDVDALVVPEDLSVALAADPEAARNFDAFPDSVKKQLLYWIAGAKRPGTRAQRIDGVARAAARGVSTPWRATGRASEAGPPSGR